MSEKKDAYVQKLKAKMDEWNAEMAKLEAKADQVKAEAKLEYGKQMEALRAKRKDLEQKIAELQQSGESVWEGLKQGLESSRASLKDSLTRAKSDFEQGYRKGREKE